MAHNSGDDRYSVTIVDIDDPAAANAAASCSTFTPCSCSRGRSRLAAPWGDMPDYPKEVLRLRQFVRAGKVAQLIARRRGASPIVNMNPIATSVIVLACVFGGALAGCSCATACPISIFRTTQKTS